MSGVRFCSCQVIKDMWGKTVHVNPSPGCQMHGKDRKNMESLLETPLPPICKTCNDTHRFPSSGHMCTSCPRPCEECRSRGPGMAGGPYCASTPCGCSCHSDSEQYRVVHRAALAASKPKEQKMLTIDLDEDGNPKSAIPIDAHASTYINMFWDELIEALAKKQDKTTISTLLKKNIFLMAEKAYRMGVARDHSEHRSVKESYDKMARLCGTLIAAVFDVGRAKTLEEAQAAAKRPMEGTGTPTIDEINEQRASFAYGQLALTSSYHEATPEKLAALRAMCRKAAGCKDEPSTG